MRSKAASACGRNSDSGGQHPLRSPEVLTESELVEADGELKALQRHALAIVDPENGRAGTNSGMGGGCATTTLREMKRPHARVQATVRCTGLLWRHRRPRLQEDLPRAAIADPPGPPQRSRHRSRLLGLEPRPAHRARQGKLTEYGGLDPAAFEKLSANLRY